MQPIVPLLVVAALFDSVSDPGRFRHPDPSAPATGSRKSSLPSLWVANRGQWPDQVVCRTLGGGCAAEVSRDRLCIRTGGEPEDWLELQLPAPLEGVAGRGAETLVSFFLGDDRRRWRAGVPAWPTLRAVGIRPGVDLLLHTHHGEVRYDLELAPGADLEALTFRVTNAVRLHAGGDGRLVMTGPFGRVVQSAPIAWQVSPDGTKRRVACAFELVGERSYRFSAPRWDHESPLLIEPTMVVPPDYATWFPGADAIAVGGSGDIYLSGSITTPFPGALTYKDFGSDPNDPALYVARIETTRNTPVGIAVFGGKAPEHAFSLDLDPGEQHVLVAVSTSSTDFPATRGAAFLDGTQRAGLLSFDAATLTQLKFSTILPEGKGVAYVRAVSGTEAILTTGDDGIAQVTMPGWGPGGGTSDAIVWRMDTQIGLPVRSMRIGGSDRDEASRAAVGGDGSVYVFIVTGAVSNASGGYLPVTSGAFRSGPTFPGSAGRGRKSTSTHDWDGFLLRLDPTLTLVEYATRLGGSGFDNGGVAASGNRIAVHGTTAAADFEPSLGGSLTGERDGYVILLDFTGFVPMSGTPAVVCATYFGGSGSDDVAQLSFDGAGRMHLGGETRGNSVSGGKGKPSNSQVPFPVLDNGTGLFKGTPAESDAFYAVLAPGGGLLYSTPIGTDVEREAGSGFCIGPAGRLYFLLYETYPTLSTTANAIYPTAPPVVSKWVGVFPPRL